MAKIYISSTYGDLKEYRKEIYRALRQMKHHVIAMEDYIATDQRPLEKCLIDVDESDVYVGIFAWRYGYIPTENNPFEKSITELEYRRAEQGSKTCLIFLLDPDALWPHKWTDQITGDGDKGALIVKLRQELSEAKLLSFFQTADELARLVVTAIHNWEEENRLRDSLSADGNKDRTEKVGQGIQILAKLFTNPEVRTAVFRYQADFLSASEQISILNQYKKIHNYFQELETRYYLLEHDRRRISTDETAWDSIEINEPELNTKIIELINQAQASSVVSTDEWWVEKLDASHTEIRNAVEKRDGMLLHSGIGKLRTVLDRQVSRINTNLIATAGTLPLKAIANAMTIIQDNLSNSNYNSNTISEFAAGVISLQELHTKLQMLVVDHNRWQDIDNVLRRVESNLENDLSELKIAWPDIISMEEILFRKRPEDWARKLRDISRKLDDALNSDGDHVIVEAKRYFRRFRSQSSHQFRKVDQNLLLLTQDLQTIGKSIDILMRSFQ